MKNYLVCLRYITICVLVVVAFLLAANEAEIDIMLFFFEKALAIAMFYGVGKLSKYWDSKGGFEFE